MLGSGPLRKSKTRSAFSRPQSHFLSLHRWILNLNFSPAVKQQELAAEFNNEALWAFTHWPWSLLVNRWPHRSALTKIKQAGPLLLRPRCWSEAPEETHRESELQIGTERRVNLQWKKSFWNEIPPTRLRCSRDIFRVHVWPWGGYIWIWSDLKCSQWIWRLRIRYSD